MLISLAKEFIGTSLLAQDWEVGYSLKWPILGEDPQAPYICKVEILQVLVYDRVGNSVIQVFKWDFNFNFPNRRTSRLYRLKIDFALYH